MMRSASPILCWLVVAMSLVRAGDPPVAAPLPPPFDPPAAWTLDFESGALWRVSDNTTANYIVLPQMISLRTPAHFRLDLGGGELTLRSRLSVLIEPIIKGPEDVYLGWSGSPSIEYWTPDHQTCVFLSVGGGFGWIDSGDEPGGQGQDFTFNWFASTGLRVYLRPNFALTAGLMFQHWSNRGATDPNPGLDALGPIIGFTWHF
jgi:lipid A 3-O-deacylase